MLKGRCTNFGNCPKADSGEILDIPAGADFECPECESELLAVNTGGDGVPAPVKLAAGVVLVGLIGIGSWLFWPQSSVVDPDIPPDPSPISTTDPDADEEFERIRALYGDSNVTQAEIERQWQNAVSTFPNDYRFSLERARHVVWANDDRHPYEYFYDAAKKAIKHGKAKMMLADLLREKTTTYRRISEGHREWKILIESLEKNDANEIEEHSPGHADTHSP